MTESTPGGSPDQGAPTFAPARDSGRPAESRGKTIISDGVVAKIAGIAARQVSGVHALGKGMARTLGAVRERVPGGRPDVTQGVKVEVGERQAAIDLDVVVEYGPSIADLAGEIRVSVIDAVEQMTSLEVVEVNVTVDDVHLPEDDEDSRSESRVQ
ncbi:Asp23/Gls24 family envelope stress response protein (plasmid) [Streptomyces viridifaciens]|nr:Asp23/Gls24 family envelope stress response protein [Streptomyces viridifaciens]